MKNRWMSAKWVGLISFLMVFLSGCGKNHLSTLKPAGEVGQEQFNLMLLSIVIMLVVVVVVTFIFVIAVAKNRRSVKGEHFQPKDVASNHTLEIIWTSIPIILLLILAVPTVYLTFKQADTSAMENDEGAVNPNVTTVNVRAYQYWWEFEYPNEEVVTSQELVVPTDKRVYFNLQGADVKHSFWVPAAGGKLDTNIDGINSFYLIFDDESAEDSNRLFYGKCAELCGPSHALMDFKVKALPEDEYDQWLADMKNVADESADEEAGEEAEESSTADADQGQEIFNNSCIGCHAVTPTGAGAVGPNLTNFGDRDLIAGFMEHNQENLEDWIRDPESHKPGNHMTGQYDLTDEEIEAVASYVMDLTVEEDSGDAEALRESRNSDGSDEEAEESADEEASDESSEDDGEEN